MALRRCLALGALLVILSVPAVPARAAEPFTFAGPAGRVQIAGPWVLRSDRNNTGIQNGWGNGGFVGSTVTVPFATSANPHRLTGRKGIAMYEGTIAWYRTRFSVPRAGRYAIDFQSVNHRATVWIDGERIGYSHDGEFQPFSKHFRADGPGKHLLVVRTDYSNIELQKATGWHRTWFNFGGINREVTVRPVGRSDIADPTVNTVIGRSAGDAVVDVTAKIHNYRQTRAIHVVGAFVREGARIPVSFPRVRVAAGATRTVRARVRVPAAALWSPEEPNLYELDLQVPGETSYSLRTGLRQLTWKGRRVYLNGRRMIMRGASLHEDAYGKGDALYPTDMDQLVADLQRIGANMTRNHHPLTPALLERLDAAGIMVWQEIGPNDSPGGWKLRTPALKRAGRRRVRESYFQLQHHPSIIVWSLANEIADDGNPYGQIPWIDHVAQELHRRDPGRMVGVDLWGTHVPASSRGMRIYRNLDVVGLTNYDGWYDNGQARGASLRRVIQRSVNFFARAFPTKVLMVTEFGGEANKHNASAAAGGWDFQTRLLRDHLTVYRNDPRVAGMLIWILRDFAVPPSFAGGSVRHEFPNIRLVRGINNKGLFTYKGKAKPSMPVVARIFRALPTFPGR